MDKYISRADRLESANDYFSVNNERWITIKPHGKDSDDYRRIKLEDGETPKEAIDRAYKDKNIAKPDTNQKEEKESYIGKKFYSMGREEEIEEFIPSLNMYRGKNPHDLDWGARLYSKEDLDNYFLPKGYDFEAEKMKKEQEEAEKIKKEQEEKIKKEQEEAEYIRDNGFTAGKSELQRGKILKDLNRQVWYKQVNSGNPTSAKKMIEELVDKGFKPTIDTFRTTRKILGERFDKDSNVKILKDKNGAFYKLNKTEYEYAKFLTSNK